jgi:hypothetical protein
MSGPHIPGVAPADAAHRRAGHEGDERPLLLSTLITLKQIVSAALSARAFGAGSAPPQSGLQSLLLSTVQHSVAGLLKTHRPDLLPSMHGPTPPLLVFLTPPLRISSRCCSGHAVEPPHAPGRLHAVARAQGGSVHNACLQQLQLLV